MSENKAKFQKTNLQTHSFRKIYISSKLEMYSAMSLDV